MLKNIIALGSLLVTCTVFAQDVSVIRNTNEVYDNSFSLGTARYSAMAGAMGALGGDISTMNSNPAGIGVAITSSLTGTLSGVSNKNETSLNGKSFSYTTNPFGLSQIGGIIAIETSKRSDWRFLNLGINYSNYNIENYIETPADASIYENITLVNPDGSTTADKLIYNGHAYDRRGNVSKLNLGTAANFKNKIYVGGSINIHSANINQSDAFSYKLGSTGEKGLYNKQNTHYSEASSGISANIGVIGKITNNFRLGVALRSPTSWSSDRAYTEYSFDVTNNEKNEVFAESRRFSTPAKLNLSAAIVANKNLSVNVDYKMNLGSPTYKSDGANTASEQLRNYFSTHDYKNTELRAGLEYRIKQFRLRGGYAMQNQNMGTEKLQVITSATSATNKSYNNLYFSDIKTLSAGLGYDFKSFFIDLAYQNSSSSYNNPFFGGIYSSAQSEFNESIQNNASIVSQVKQTRNSILIGMGWKF